MRRETHSCVVDASPEALWDYLLDYDRVIRLGDSADFAEREISPKHPERIKYKACLHWEDIPAIFHAYLRCADRPRLLEWKTISFAGRTRTLFEFSPFNDDKTEVKLTFELSTPESSAPLEPFAWAIIIRKVRHMGEELGRLRLRDGKVSF
ncbi:MAG: SRPBCC family protein [Coriobacteriia bacterium]